MPLQPYPVAPLHVEPAIAQKILSLNARFETLLAEYQPSKEQWNAISYDVRVYFQKVWMQVGNCSQARADLALTENAMSASPKEDNVVLHNALFHIKMLRDIVPIPIPIPVLVAGGPTHLEEYLTSRLWTVKHELKKHEALLDCALEKVSMAIDALHDTLNSAREEAAELLQKMSLCALKAPDPKDADVQEEGVQEREIDATFSDQDALQQQAFSAKLDDSETAYSATSADLTQADADVKPQLVATALNEGAGDLNPY